MAARACPVPACLSCPPGVLAHSCAPRPAPHRPPRRAPPLAPSRIPRARSWDLRDAPSAADAASACVAKLSVAAHEADVMSLSFNPYQEHLLLSASTDKTVKLWDMRSFKEPMHTFHGHTDDVTGVAWAPFNPSVFASCGADRKVIVWDCARIGEEQDEEDAEDGPPELLFIHGGHTAKVSDFSWSETEDWVIASVAEDNVCQVWQMGEQIFSNSQGEEEEEKEKEEKEKEKRPPTKKARKEELE